MAKQLEFAVGLKSSTNCLNMDELLAAGPLQGDRARNFARQIAEATWAAHRRHRLPADLSLSDFMLEGAGQNELVVLPELDASRPRMQRSVRSEVYLFGQLLDAILPGHPLAVECTATDPYDRPDSLEAVIEELQDISTRRTWIGSVLIGAAMSSLYFYQRTRPPIRSESPSRQGW